MTIIRICGLVLCMILAPFSLLVAKDGVLNYRVEASALASDGNFAPLWFTANRYGVMSNESNQASLRAGVFVKHDLKHYWRVETGVELNGGASLVSSFHVHQAYADISWKKFTIGVGAKERMGSPLDKDVLMAGGWMVEGPNVRPIPQVRGEVKDYLVVPGTKNWVAFKGHLAYGWFADGNWQENFAGLEQKFTQNVLYHSKSLMFRFGERNTFPLEFELGIITAAQFGGKRFLKQADGSIKEVADMPNGIKDFFSIFIPKQKSTLENVSGNHCGSWNFALNAYAGDWKFRTYYEHYFEDHSQMAWQYGRWKDGLIGIEIKPVKNRWITSVVWEGMSTKDQTGPVLYDGVGGSFSDLQMSGNDHYYNNHEYLGWQYYGATLGHPFLYGPQYNADGSNYIKSTRVRSNHLAVLGHPSDEWNWRLLTSFARHWGTYRQPLDKQRKQFSGMLEVTYLPSWTKGWSASLAFGLDRGNYLGNNVGGMLTLRKTGGIGL